MYDVIFSWTALFDFSKAPCTFTAIVPARTGRMDSDNRDIPHALAHTVDDSVLSQARTVSCRLPSRVLRTRGFEPGRVYFLRTDGPVAVYVVVDINWVNQPAPFRARSPVMPQPALTFSSFEKELVGLLSPRAFSGPFCRQLMC